MALLYHGIFGGVNNRYRWEQQRRENKFNHGVDSEGRNLTGSSQKRQVLFEL